MRIFGKAQLERLRLLAISVTFWMVWGVAVFYRDFAKIKIGPLFMLEFGTGIWLAIALRDLLKLRGELWRNLRWAYAFLGYGCLLLAMT